MTGGATVKVTAAESVRAVGPDGVHGGVGPLTVTVAVMVLVPGVVEEMVAIATPNWSVTGSGGVTTVFEPMAVICT